jgi:hypothetical protein
MEVVAPNMKMVTSSGLTRLADSLARAVNQPDTVLDALGLSRENLTERRRYVVSEIDTRYRTNADDTLTAWVENQWFDADRFDEMILSIPVARVHVAQLSLVS